MSGSYRRIATGTKMQYPAISRMGANVSPPIAKSAYPNTITTKATAHHTNAAPTARRGRAPFGDAVGVPFWHAVE